MALRSWSQRSISRSTKRARSTEVLSICRFRVMTQGQANRAPSTPPIGELDEQHISRGCALEAADVEMTLGARRRPHAGEARLAAGIFAAGDQLEVEPRQRAHHHTQLSPEMEPVEEHLRLGIDLAIEAFARVAAQPQLGSHQAVALQRRAVAHL